MSSRNVSLAIRSWIVIVISILFLSAPRAVSAQTVEVLHSFSGCVPTGCADGDDSANPRSTLVRGADGNLYGTTNGIGAANGGGQGSIFKIDSNGVMTTLFVFPATFLDGGFPVGALAHGSDGAFYGVTAIGGLHGDGTLFRVTSDGSFTKLHDFDVDGNPQNNGGPGGGLVQGPDGKFYGTTLRGGTSNLGTVFRLEEDGSVTTLRNFSGSDGMNPMGDLMLASDGNIYGTTANGGNAGGACAMPPSDGCGTIFRILQSGTISILHSFEDIGSSGFSTGPTSALIQGTDQNLYGTRYASNAAFKMTLNGAYTLLHHFSSSSEGYLLRGSLLQGADGNFYGTTERGRAADRGTIFRMTPAGAVTYLHDFLGTEGSRPFAGLVQGADGHLYGTTLEGGAYNLGVVFRLKLPRAQDGTLAVVEDTTKAGTLIATDPNNAPLTFSIVTNGFRGTVAITDTVTGAFTYTPNPDANGTDSFTFQVNNGTVDSNVATITVTIDPVNDPPVAQLGNLTTDEDTAAGGRLVASDVDSATLTHSVVTNGTKGTAVVTNAATGEFTYTPTLNASGADSFTFKANDGSLDSNVAAVSVSITPVNDAPVASNGTASTTPGAPVSGALVATDIDSSTLTYSIVTNPTKGSAVVTNTTTGAYTYTPDAGASGNDTFTFKANDGALDSNAATITVTIAGNASPVASNGTLTTSEDAAARGTLQATDPEGQALLFSLVSNGIKGTVTITNASLGRYRYVPQPNANGMDSFMFKANDGASDSNVATVTITITPVNDAPVASDSAVTTVMNQAVGGTLQATDVDGDPLTFALARAPRRGSAVVSSTGAFTYTPRAGFTGIESFAFRVTDAAGASSRGIVTVTVTP